MKRVLITGGSGFLGRQILAQFPSHMAVFGTYHRHPADGKEIQCDLLNERAIDKLIQTVRPTHLIHAAWNVTHGVYWTSPENQEWKRASMHLIKTFYANGGRRFIGIGTCAEYCWNADRPLKEDHPLIPATPYGKAKAELFSACMEAFPQSAWARLFHLFGPNEAPGRLIPTVISNLLFNRDVPCTHGNQVRDFMAVQEVASALAALLDSDLTGPVNVASGKPMTVRDLLNRISMKINSAGKLNFGAVAPPPNDVDFLVADTQRLNKELGWKPKHSIDYHIDQTLDTYAACL